MEVLYWMEGHDKLDDLEVDRPCLVEDRLDLVEDLLDGLEVDLCIQVVDLLVQVVVLYGLVVVLLDHLVSEPYFIFSLVPQVLALPQAPHLQQCWLKYLDLSEEL